MPVTTHTPVTTISKSLFVVLLGVVAIGCTTQEQEPIPEVCTPPNPIACDPGAELQVNQFGPGENQFIASIGHATNGDVIIGGGFQGTIDVGDETLTSAGQSDSFIARLDNNGVVLWSARHGDALLDSLRAVVVAPTGETYIVGLSLDNNIGSIYVNAYDQTGERLWTKSFGSDMYVNGIDAGAAPNGDLIIAVTFDGGQLSFGGATFSGLGIAYARLSSVGAHVASRIIDGSATTIGVAIDDAGNTYLATHFPDTLDFGGSVGTINAPSPSSTSAIAKLGPSGDAVWARPLSSSIEGVIIASLIALTPGGDPVVFGRYSGNVTDLGATPLPTPQGESFLIATFDGTGATTTTATFGDATFVGARDLTIDKNGNMLLAAITSPTPSDNDADGLIKKLSAAGNTIWSRDYAGIGRQVAAAVTATNEAVFIGGSFMNDLELDSDNTLTATDIDGFVIKLAP